MTNDIPWDIRAKPSVDEERRLLNLPLDELEALIFQMTPPATEAQEIYLSHAVVIRNQRVLDQKVPVNQIAPEAAEVSALGKV